HISKERLLLSVMYAYWPCTVITPPFPAKVLTERFFGTAGSDTSHISSELESAKYAYRPCTNMPCPFEFNVFELTRCMVEVPIAPLVGSWKDVVVAGNVPKRMPPILS